MSWTRRLSTVGLASAVICGSAVSLGAVSAGADSNTAGVFRACGYAVEAGPPAQDPSGCTSLSAAITAADAYDGPATIELMPGAYCPTDFPQSTFDLLVEGVGMAGVNVSDGPVAIDGPEAGLSAFEWDSVHCAGAPTADVTITGDLSADRWVSFANLAFIGAATGPTVGLESTDANVGFSDVLVKGFTDLGVELENTELEATNDAIVSNGTGLYTQGVDGWLYQSTVADNSGNGLDLADGTFRLDHDTVAHNGAGLNTRGNDLDLSAENSIVGANTADCTGGGYALEQGPPPVGNNLLGENCYESQNGTTDVLLTDSVDEPDLNGGPTPSILPPDQALGAARSLDCGADQRLYVVTDHTSCDIGSVNTSNGITGAAAPEADTTPLAFGAVPTNSPMELSTTIRNSGGGLGGVSSVSVSGTGFSLAAGADGCTYFLLYPQSSNYCWITVTAAPTQQGDISGTLSVKLLGVGNAAGGGGVINIPLTASGAAPVPGDSSALAATHSLSIRYGAATTVTTTLTDKVGNAAIGGASVTLLSRAGTSGAFSPVKTTTTSPAGKASASVHPRVNTQYKWGFAGAGRNDGATSTAATVSVMQVVHAALSAPTVKRHKAVKVYGTVSPNASGKTVRLERLVAGKWKPFGGKAKIVRQKLPNGRKAIGYVLTLTPTQQGKETLRVLRAATPTNAAGTSPRLSLSVLPAAGAAVRNAADRTSRVTDAPAGRAGELSSVSAVPHSNVIWVTGDAGPPYFAPFFVARRQGGHWTRAATPRLGPGGGLDTVAAPSASAVWIGGAKQHGDHDFPAIWQWTHGRFVKAKLPALKGGGVTTNVGSLSASSASNVWAVGALVRTAAGAPVALHWNGRKWSAVAVPEDLEVVSTSGPNNAWALGARGDLAHWNGSAWSVEDPGYAQSNDFISGIATSSPTLAYAVGYNTDNGQSALLRFNGHAWSAAPLAKKARHLTLNSVSMRARSAWAVGLGGAGPVVVHTTGGTWQRAQALSGQYVVFAISAASATRAVVVGLHAHGAGSTTYLETYNGHSWQGVSSRF